MASTEHPSAVALLRVRTRAAHDAVDSVFGTHDLSDRAAYTHFLLAHARALPVAEARMRMVAEPLGLVPRTPLLAADLADLGEAMPPVFLRTQEPRITNDDANTSGFLRSQEPAAEDAWAWGTLYVVEGSRLGGAFLVRQVPPGLPARYLGATHPAGAWRTIREAIDRAAAGKDAAWRERLVVAALATFDLYAAATNGG